MEKFKNKYRIQSHRMPGWDYSGNGIYFITLVTKNRECILGEIVDKKMILSEFGKIVDNEWNKSFEIRNELVLDEYIIMPNHLHAIIVLDKYGVVKNGFDESDGTHGTHVETHGRASLRAYQQSPQQSPQQSDKQQFFRKPKSISSFIGGFKSAVNSKIDDYIDENNLDILICGKDVFKPWSGTADIHDIVVYRVNFDGSGKEGISIPLSDVATRYNVVNMRERSNKDICITGYTSNAYFFLELTKELNFKKMTLHALENEKMTFREMKFLEDGNMLIAGHTSMNASIETSSNPNRFIFIKTNAEGNPLWAKAYDAPSPLCNIIFDKYNSPDIPVFVSETPSGTCLIQTACLSGSDAYAYKIGHVFAIGQNGNTKWGRSLRPDTASFFGQGYTSEIGEHLLMASTKEFCKTDSTISLIMIPTLTEGFSYKGSQKADLTFACNHTFTTDTIVADIVAWNKFNSTTRPITRDCELAVKEIK